MLYKIESKWASYFVFLNSNIMLGCFIETRFNCTLSKNKFTYTLYPKIPSYIKYLCLNLKPSASERSVLRCQHQTMKELNHGFLKNSDSFDSELEDFI